MATILDTMNVDKHAHIQKDMVWQFGDRHDGVIEIPALTRDAGVVEIGYYYGDLKPKNIIGISTQIGCPSKCTFCELGAERFGRNLTPVEMYGQVVLMLETASQYGIDVNAVQHKVSVAKTGEPLFNDALVGGLEMIAEFPFSYKISTVFPAAQRCLENFRTAARFAAQSAEAVQMQISLISTSEDYRRKAAGIEVTPLQEICKAGEYWKNLNPYGRKVNLSLILSEDVPCDAQAVSKILSPELFHFRFRNYVPTQNGKNHSLAPITSGRIARIKQEFSEYGYEVTAAATPTAIEQKFSLAANVTRRRYMQIVQGTW